jgi:hypothetical protein
MTVFCRLVRWYLDMLDPQRVNVRRNTARGVLYNIRHTYIAGVSRYSGRSSRQLSAQQHGEGQSSHNWSRSVSTGPKLKLFAHRETGPSGLSMLKQLREDGFAAALFERRSRVGGLWAYSEDKQNTTALPSRFCVVVRGFCPADCLRQLTIVRDARQH